MDHLLLHFPIAKEKRNMVFALFRVKWVMLGRVVDLLATWQGCFG